MKSQSDIKIIFFKNDNELGIFETLNNRTPSA